MLELSAEQRSALSAEPGALLLLRDPATQQTFVLLPVDEYDRLSNADYDSSPWTDEEMDLLAAESMVLLDDQNIVHSPTAETDEWR